MQGKNLLYFFAGVGVGFAGSSLLLVNNYRNQVKINQSNYESLMKAIKDGQKSFVKILKKLKMSDLGNY